MADIENDPPAIPAGFLEEKPVERPPEDPKEGDVRPPFEAPPVDTPAETPPIQPPAEAPPIDIPQEMPPLDPPVGGAGGW